MELIPASVNDEFKKHPELTSAAMDYIRGWTIQQPHLPKISDLNIAIFLHSCYFSTERTKQTIENYYTLRTHVPEFFSNRDPSHPTIANTTQVVTCFPLPELTDSGDKVIYIVLNETEPSKYNYTDALKYFIHIEDMLLHEMGSQHGTVIVFDLTGVSFGHLGRLSIMSMKKFFYYLQEAMPVRLKGLHFINVVPVMDKMVAMMKPLMKSELMQMLHIHADGMDSLYRFIPQRIMPADFGGASPSVKIQREQIISKINANAKFFMEEETHRVNEALRRGKAKNAVEIFGVDGSFRKLDID